MDENRINGEGPYAAIDKEGAGPDEPYEELEKEVPQKKCCKHRHHGEHGKGCAHGHGHAKGGCKHGKDLQKRVDQIDVDVESLKKDTQRLIEAEPQQADIWKAVQEQGIELLGEIKENLEKMIVNRKDAHKLYHTLREAVENEQDPSAAEGDLVVLNKEKEQIKTHLKVVDMQYRKLMRNVTQALEKDHQE